MTAPAARPLPAPADADDVGDAASPGVAVVEDYTDARMAEFMLNNAVDADDYARQRRAVADDFGIDPDRVPHDPPPGVRRDATAASGNAAAR